MASEGNKIRYIVQTIDTDNIYLYRNPASGSASQIATISGNKKVIASRVSEDKKYYFIPALNAWIPSEKITIVDTVAPVSFTNKEIRNAERRYDLRNDLSSSQEDKLLDPEGTNIDYTVQTKDFNQVYLYRNPNNIATTEVTTAAGNRELRATRLSEDGKFLYIPSMNAWISTTYVNIISRRTPKTVSGVLSSDSVVNVNVDKTTDNSIIDEETKDIRYVVQTRDQSYIFLYRNPTGLSSDQISVIDGNKQMIATKVTEDNKYYYIPALNAWMGTNYATVVSKSAPDRFTDTEVRNITDVNLIETNITTTTTSGGETVNPTWNIIPEKYLTPQQTVNANLAKFDNDGGWHITNNTTTSDTILKASKSTANGGLYVTVGKTNLSGIFGLPYQFAANVDRRLDSSNGRVHSNDDGIGRKFAEKILTRNNLIYLMPCIQDFMTGASNEDRSGAVGALLGQTRNYSGLLGKYARYYTAVNAIDDYYKYVNSMCQSTAIYLGIGNETISVGGASGKAAGFLWQNALEREFQKTIGAVRNIVFYVDGLNSVSESFSNDTRESSLASQVNGLSDEAKELNFVTKSDYGSRVGGALEGATSSVLMGTADALTNGEGILHAILGNSSALMSGGKLAFPELWNDSSYDRSYTINFKFRTPEADPVSIYLNIIVPYIHLIAMTAPHDYAREDNNSNSYREPFLVRATFKGMFAVDMGLITDLSSDRGGEGSWSLDGLPTQLDVSMTIKDLYKSLYISSKQGTSISGGSIPRFYGNDGLTDYLMGLAGVNMAYPLWDRKVDAYLSAYSYSLKNAIGNLGLKLQKNYTDLLDRIF